MNPENIAFTLDLIGKLMIAYTAISVHLRLSHEHKVDAEVIHTIKTERWVGIAGIILMILGWLIHVL